MDKVWEQGAPGVGSDVGAWVHTIQASLDQSDLLVSYLAQLQIEYVFGVPGGAIEPLYNALARSRVYDGPQHVLARHETGAAFMAQGYTLETGKLGVCCTTTGPGATNIFTGVASAYQEEVPMLLITAQTQSGSFGKNAFQDSSAQGVDIVAMLAPCTRYNALVSSAEQFEQALVSAIRAAFGPVRGPVHLSVPSNILRSPHFHKKPAYNLPRLLRPHTTLDFNATLNAWSVIRKAKRPVLLMGEGVAPAAASIVRFAESIAAPIIVTPGAKGFIDPAHSLFTGVFGFAGHASAHAVLAHPDVDCIIAVGSSLGEWDTGGWDPVLLNERLIHVDDTAQHFLQSPMARMHVLGNLYSIFEGLHDLLDREQFAPKRLSYSRLTISADSVGVPASAQNSASCVHPKHLMQTLSSLFCDDTRFVADVGNSTAWAVRYLNIAWPAKANTCWFRTSVHFAAMGWAIGHAIGLALGNRKTPVVCITGDGSFLMNGQELTVAVAEKLNIVFVILNDSSLGMVKHGQQLNAAENIANTLPPVDFYRIAKAQGARAYKIKELDDLLALNPAVWFEDALPTVLDVHIDGDAVPPIESRINVLKEKV